MQRYSNIGRAASLILTDKWHEVEPDRVLSLGQQRREFHHNQNDEVQIIFYSRGSELSDSLARDVRNVLAGDPHPLSDQEFRSIEVILGNACEPDYFDRSSIATEFLNGIKILSLEGVWKRSNLYDRGFFVPVDELCTRVEEWHFVAPQGVEQRFWADAAEVFGMVLWASG